MLKYIKYKGYTSYEDKKVLLSKSLGMHIFG